MKACTLIVLAALATLSTAGAATEQAGTTEILSAARAQAGGVASLTDGECIAIVNFTRRAKTGALLAVLDSIEQEEELEETDFARLAAAQPMDGMPADLCDYVKEVAVLLAATQDKLRPLEEQLEELRRSEEEDIQEKMKPLLRQYRDIRKQHEKDEDALKQRYPRAAFLRKHLSSYAAQEALADLHRERGKAKDFLATHPRLKPGKRATAMAYLRYLAEEEQPEPTGESARDTVTKLDLLDRLNFTDYGMAWSLPPETTRPIIFPDDRSSGYSWQLATPLPEDTPVQLEWLTLPSAEMKNLQDLGVLPAARDYPTSPDTTIAAIRTVKAGKMTLHFVYRKPGEAEPLLQMKFTLEVEADED